MPSWSLSPDSYTCSQHPENSLTEEVRAQLGDCPLPVPGGGYLNLRRPQVVVNAMGKVRRTVQALTAWKGPTKGPFSVWADCPGVEGSEKDEDKPHPELCQGDVL